MNILVAEDTRMLNLIVTRTLESLNHRVFSVSNGSEAITILNKEDVHFMILDNYLPELTAVDILSKIKSNRVLSSIPVIILTALEEETVTKEEYPNIISIMQKPVTPEELKKKFNKIMEENLIGGNSYSDNEDEEFFNDLKNEYREEWLKRVHLMFKALENKDYKHLRMEAHDLIGSGPTFGYKEVVQIATNIQKNIEQLNDRAIEDNLYELRTILKQASITL